MQTRSPAPLWGMMKIRTKLLLALAGISLIPAIAAYFTLINNPRISFALRMNKYEAQQGLTAQKLQADLQAIGSAVSVALTDSCLNKIQSLHSARVSGNCR